MRHRLSWIAVGLVAGLLLALPTALIAQTQISPAPAGGFAKQNFFGVWSKAVFADAVTITGPAKTIYLAGMGSEDETDGKILHPGDFLEQCRYAYGKIKKVLAQQGATMHDIVKITAYVTDTRMRADYAKCRGEALGDAPLPTHTFLNVSQLAWPGMLVEVDATAVVAAK
jgi:enamine deaminase RidA (YjgF/YER057c/UK114 family)